MDYAHRDRCRIAWTLIQKRVHELSKRAPLRFRVASPLVLRRLKFLVLAVGAILFGISAHRLNQREAELGWRKSHIPTPEIWTASFSAIGFREIVNPSEVGRISRNLPTLTDPLAGVWMSSPDWWAVLGNASSPKIYCLSCDLKNAPKSWSRVGDGWEGWDAAMERAKQQKPLESRSKRKKIEFRDPREIRY